MSNTQYEIPNEMRDFAEKSVDQARKAFEGYLTAAQQAVGKMESVAQSAGVGTHGATSKAVGFAGENVNAAFELARKLMAARDLQEVVALQSEFAKSQLSAMQTQAKELAGMAQAAAKAATIKS